MSLRPLVVGLIYAGGLTATAVRPERRKARRESITTPRGPAAGGRTH